MTKYNNPYPANPNASRQPRRKRKPKQKGLNTGRFDTTVQEPAARGIIHRRRGAQIYGSPHTTSVFMSHTEPILQIATAALGAFAVQGSAVIPAALGYLAGIAQNFSKFKWHYLELIYIPFVPTTTSGEFAMGMQYDRTDAPPTTAQQVEQLSLGVTTPIWGGADGVHRLHSNTQCNAVNIVVDVTKFDKPYYPFEAAGNFAALGTSDQNTYCPCTVQAITIGGPATAITLAGRLMVRYTVELLDPIIAALNT